MNSFDPRKPSAEESSEPGNGVQPTVWERLNTCKERLTSIGRQQNDPAVLSRKLADRAKILRARIADKEMAEAGLTVLTFNKGRERYAVPLDHILEVQSLDYYSAIPRTPLFLPGVIHWRGAILALLDVGKLLGTTETGITDVHGCIIVEDTGVLTQRRSPTVGRRVALVAGEIGEIVQVATSSILPAPELCGSAPPDWVYGVYDDNRLVLRVEMMLQDTRLVEWKSG